MKKKTVMILAGVLAAALLAGCGGSGDSSKASSAAETVSSVVSEVSEAASSVFSEVSEAISEAVSEEVEIPEAVLPDGVYTAEFTTDSSMFHVNEALEGKGILTVENGQMTIHISLAGKGILNLYLGTAEEAKADEAGWLAYTEDEVTYSDGLTDTVYGFDVPVPVLDEEFDVALVGTKGTWYDHKVMVSNVVPNE